MWRGVRLQPPAISSASELDREEVARQSDRAAEDAARLLRQRRGLGYAAGRQVGQQEAARARLARGPAGVGGGGVALDVRAGRVAVETGDLVDEQRGVPGVLDD